MVQSMPITHTMPKGLSSIVRLRIPRRQSWLSSRFQYLRQDIIVGKKSQTKLYFCKATWNMTKTCMRNMVGKSKMKSFGRKWANLPQPLHAKVHRQANRAVLQLLRLRYPASKAVKDISLPHQTESTTQTAVVTGATPKTADCTTNATIKLDT